MTPSKTILITGASSGIGRATAVRLADDGHTVFAAARRLDRLAELARETTGTVIPVELDVCDPGSVRKAVEAVADVAPDGLDVLINNAGYALTGPAETLATDDVRAQFETNVIGLFDVTRAFLPQMRARRSGRIVNISSLLGEISVPGSGIYGGTKHAIEALSDALRMELKQFGISVVVVQPSFVSTEIDVTQPHGDERWRGRGLRDARARAHGLPRSADQSGRDARGRRCLRRPREPHATPQGALRHAETRRPGPRHAHNASHPTHRPHQAATRPRRNLNRLRLRSTAALDDKQQRPAANSARRRLRPRPSPGAQTPGKRCYSLDANAGGKPDGRDVEGTRPRFWRARGRWFQTGRAHRRSFRSSEARVASSALLPSHRDAPAVLCGGHALHRGPRVARVRVPPARVALGQRPRREAVRVDGEGDRDGDREQQRRAGAGARCRRAG